MNSFLAEITEIESIQTLHRVQLDSKGCTLSLISLELAENVQVKSRVQLYVKSTNIFISRHQNSELSIANQIPVTIISLKQGLILTTLKLDFYGIVLESMLTTKQANNLRLKEKESVYALINESDLSLSLLEG